MTREQLYDLTLSDPNNRYMATLSPDQWEQYSLALAGVPDANDPRITSVGGCLGEAHDAVPGVYAAYNALREPYEQIQESIAADPRVAAADNQWSTCMADYGYSYESRSSVVERR